MMYILITVVDHYTMYISKHHTAPHIYKYYVSVKRNQPHTHVSEPGLHHLEAVLCLKLKEFKVVPS